MNFFERIQKQISTISPAFTYQTDAEVVEEIHDTFYTEVDRLLAKAMNANSLETDCKELLEKSDRLAKLGFRNTNEVKTAQVERDRINALKKENREKIALRNAIGYFAHKYPHYKFITEDSVKYICEKYGLIYGEVKNYIGTVPDKNLKQIEMFKIADEDLCYERWRRWEWGALDSTLVKYDEYKAFLEESNGKHNERHIMYEDRHSKRGVNKCPLEICAPPKDFDMTNMEIKDKKLMRIQPKDPVVLQPVFFNNTKYYLIVTAWGPEASDPAVVNERMN